MSVIFIIQIVVACICTVPFFLTDYIVRKEMGLLGNSNIGIYRRFKFYKDKVKFYELNDIKNIFRINIISSLIFLINLIVILLISFLYILKLI